MFKFLEELDKLSNIFDFNLNIFEGIDFQDVENSNEAGFGGESFLPFYNPKIFESDYKNEKKKEEREYFEPDFFMESHKKMQNFDTPIKIKPLLKNEEIMDIHKKIDTNLDFEEYKTYKKQFQDGNIVSQKPSSSSIIPIYEENFNIKNFIQEETKEDSQEANYEKISDGKKIINKTIYVINKNETKTDIDYIGTEIAKQIEKACINRSVSDIY